MSEYTDNDLPDTQQRIAEAVEIANELLVEDKDGRHLLSTVLTLAKAVVDMDARIDDEAPLRSARSSELDTIELKEADGTVATVCTLDVMAVLDATRRSLREAGFSQDDIEDMDLDPQESCIVVLQDGDWSIGPIREPRAVVARRIWGERGGSYV